MRQDDKAQSAGISAPSTPRANFAQPQREQSPSMGESATPGETKAPVPSASPRGVALSTGGSPSTPAASEVGQIASSSVAVTPSNTPAPESSPPPGGLTFAGTLKSDPPAPGIAGPGPVIAPAPAAEVLPSTSTAPAILQTLAKTDKQTIAIEATTDGKLRLNCNSFAFSPQVIEAGQELVVRWVAGQAVMERRSAR